VPDGSAVSGGQAGEGQLQPPGDLVGDWCEIIAPDHREERERIDRRNDRLALVVGIHDDVAGQQQAELGFGRQRLMRQRRVAGAEDGVRPALDTELRAERRLYVDGRQNAEALLAQQPGDRLDGSDRLERGVTLMTVGVLGRGHGMLLCSSLDGCQPAHGRRGIPQPTGPQFGDVLPRSVVLPVAKVEKARVTLALSQRGQATVCASLARTSFSNRSPHCRQTYS
jgi:hypothetical protein